MKLPAIGSWSVAIKASPAFESSRLGAKVLRSGRHQHLNRHDWELKCCDRELKHRDRGVIGVWIIAIGSWSVAGELKHCDRELKRRRRLNRREGWIGKGRRSVAGVRQSVTSAKEGEALPVTSNFADEFEKYGFRIWVSLMRNMGFVDEFEKYGFRIWVSLMRNMVFVDEFEKYGKNWAD